MAAAPQPRWRENKGRCPPDLKGTNKRVVVELANGSIAGAEPASKEAPAGWPADGKGHCRWTLEGHAFDIRRFYVIGEK